MNSPRIIAAALITPLAAAAAFIAPLAAAPAAASEKRIEVRYDDLDLATADGRKELNQRIRSAANQYCGSRTITGSRISSHACADDVRSAVLAQIKSRQSGSAMAAK
jgi:UrcA family protein